eukprot:gene18400-24871_t
MLKVMVAMVTAPVKSYHLELLTQLAQEAAAASAAARVADGSMQLVLDVLQALADDKMPVQAIANDRMPRQAIADDKMPVQASADDKMPVQAIADDRVPIQATAHDRLAMADVKQIELSQDQFRGLVSQLKG